jgi:hypothetical protein
MTDNANDRTCASCYYFNPCPCGACLYGVCDNTCSTHLHEYVHEDLPACNAYMLAFAEVTGKLTYSTGEGLR